MYYESTTIRSSNVPVSMREDQDLINVFPSVDGFSNGEEASEFAPIGGGQFTRNLRQYQRNPDETDSDEDEDHLTEDQNYSEFLNDDMNESNCYSTLEHIITDNPQSEDEEEFFNNDDHTYHFAHSLDNRNDGYEEEKSDDETYSLTNKHDNNNNNNNNNNQQTIPSIAPLSQDKVACIKSVMQSIHITKRSFGADLIVNSIIKNRPRLGDEIE
eukprot:CAMPEP_0182420904 /NCGR_PEP_ID=MMETSP1167-20130531/6003_1 /TAXON_ID=2988 /ORGANISM="Mallomonas Sp, Strain CCMP3275" /LENGTH=213 /DNA_ID=CAMNT_0024597453 /DNA_START=146 /DNA_END=787 /DNA_ORIENTATION=-